MDQDTIEGLIVCGAGFGFGVLLFLNGFWLRHKKKLIENIPTSKIRSVAVGLVEIAGSAKPFGETFPSPFAKAPCVYYKYTVQEERGSGKNRHWVTIAKDASRAPFFVKDETGEMMVDPNGAELHLDVDHSYRTGVFSENSDIFKTGLTDLGIDANGFLGMSRKMKCTEIYVQADDSIYVMGHALPKKDVPGSAVGAENLILNKKNKRDIFMISDKSEKDLVKNFGWKLMGCLWGGPILAVGCLWGIIGLLS